MKHKVFIKLLQRHLLQLLCLLTIFSCRKAFNPSVTATNVNYLVVEGVINGGPDSTIIKLSRTTTVGSSNNIANETGASVTVISDAGDKYVLLESSPGAYTFNGLNLPVTKKYCLNITTSNGEEYQSEFMANEQTPAIDSVGYNIKPTGLQFYVNTHNVTNNTHYYRWDYDETWTYFTQYKSELSYKDNQVFPRLFDSLINECYHHFTPSNSIFVATSNKLAQDVIYQYPLGYVDAATGKISHVYSLLVKQYAITTEAYNYWTLLKKNTEQLGSIFDAQPLSTTGNIHCLNNPAEPVIGFISVSTIATKRIFVSGYKVPFHVPDGAVPADTIGCNLGAIYFAPTFTLNARLFDRFGSGDYIPISFIVPNGSNMAIGYAYAAKQCVDCRLWGGTNIKPSYWPY